MKTRIFSLLIALQVTAVASFAQVFKADAEKSTLAWHAEKITGFHDGTIALKSGTFKVEKDKIISGSFIIDMNTITDTDLSDKGYNDKLVGHLKSADFFDVAKFPEAVFTITKPVDLTKSVTDVHGTLTVKGITKPLSFKAVVLKVGGSFSFNANSIVVDRTQYSIKYGSGTFFSDLGDKVIYDEFNVRLKLMAVQQ